MLDQLFALLQAELQKNQFLSGGMLLMVLGTVGVLCRKFPLWVWNRVNRWFWISVEVRSTDRAFNWISRWLATLPYSKDKARLLYLSTNYEDEAQLVPGFGNHWFFYKGRLVRLYRTTTEGTDSNSREEPYVKPQVYHLNVLTRNRKLVLDLIKEARASLGIDTSEMMKILTPSTYGGWHEIGHRLRRPLRSVVLKEGLGESILKDVQRFVQRSEWYIERGIPYRRGYLLKGPPGNGKSSFITAIAGELKYNIAILNLSDSGLTDTKLRELISELPPNTILVIEDVDCVFIQRENTKDNKSVSFSGLLNALDGIAAGEGRILFMTTNHPEKLDPALIRPGRVDVQIELGAPTKEQTSSMFLRFFPEASLYDADRFGELCNLPNMAAVQGHLILHQDPDLAIQNLSQEESLEHVECC